ncbi:MAG: hypothetical protein LBQ46_01595 [Treponema sp.]|jgi:hypothetical protein|nr:hypothetical protein [Treponema sp.]
MRKIPAMSVPLIFCLLQAPAALDAQNNRARSEPVAVNLIIDGSRSMRDAGGAAAAWIGGYLLDGLLQDGDYLRIWAAGEQASVLYDGTLTGDRKDAVKALVRDLPLESAAADFAGALRGSLSSPPQQGRLPLMTYTLLVSSPQGLSPAHLSGAAPYLRYSRVMEFPGWRALVIAADIGGQVREAAASFLSGL